VAIKVALARDQSRLVPVYYRGQMRFGSIFPSELIIIGVGPEGRLVSELRMTANFSETRKKLRKKLLFKKPKTTCTDSRTDLIKYSVGRPIVYGCT